MSHSMKPDSYKAQKHPPINKNYPKLKQKVPKYGRKQVSAENLRLRTLRCAGRIYGAALRIN